MQLIGKFFLILMCFALLGCKIFGKAQNPKEKEERDLLGFTNQENPRILEVQLLLQEKGFDPGVINGRLMPESRKAITRFQNLYHVEPSGFIDARTLIELNRLSKSDDNPSILTRLDEGIERKLIYKKIEVKSKKNSLNTRRNKSKYTNQTVKIQNALKNAGFDPGPIDGKLGKKTIAAITQFQISESLKADGILGSRTWERLKGYF